MDWLSFLAGFGTCVLWVVCAIAIVAAWARLHACETAEAILFEPSERREGSNG
jgi:hypothetical protein